MSFPFRYELSLKGVEVKLGPFTIRRIPYSDIEGIVEGYGSWFYENWNNLWPWRFLTIKRKSGLFKNLMINPKDRAGFAAELRKRLGA